MSRYRDPKLQVGKNTYINFAELESKHPENLGLIFPSNFLV